MSLKIPLKYSMIWQSYANDKSRIARSRQKREADWLVFTVSMTIGGEYLNFVY